jgi:hypothetical protein
MLDLARALRERGEVPALADRPALSMVRAVSLQLAPEDSWRSEESRRHMRAELGKGFGYTP